MVPTEQSDLRVLLAVTTQRDAEITASLLSQVGLTSLRCDSTENLSRYLTPDIGALLFTEEAIHGRTTEIIGALRQPSTGFDLPAILLTKGGAMTPSAARLFREVANLTILERPAPINSIVSAVQGALRVRRGQQELTAQISRIKELQQELAMAVEASNLGTFHCPMPLGTILWNVRCKAHFWLPPEAEIDFTLFFSLLHPDDREKTRHAINACVYDGKDYDVEYRAVSPRGEIRWIRATGRTWMDEHAKPVRFSGTTQDITERKAWEREREQLLEGEQAARSESEKANRLKDEFLATLSHELRTPLNAIQGWVELLKYEAEDPKTVREGIDVIGRNVRVQTQLVEDLLDVSRIISGKVRLDIKTLRIRDVVDAAVETVMPAAVAKGVRLQTIADGETPPISGDFARLQQVLWNLLTNAVKFTPRGGRVQTVIEQRNSAVDVHVTDTGEGIAAEFVPFVFDRFAQADGSASRKHGGLGLGLSIVKTLVEMHGGQIVASSKGKGQGASFRVQLPIRLALDTDASVPELGALSPPTPLAFARPNFTGLKVLIVDDQSDARNMMFRLLAGCHATLAEAAGAEEALNLVSNFKPHLIVSDIGMPGMDGYQFIRQVRKQGYTVPAVALSAYARTEDRIRSIQSGFQVHLTKPVESAELLASIASLSRWPAAQ